MESESLPTSIELAHNAAAQLTPPPLSPPTTQDDGLLDNSHDQDDISLSVTSNVPQHQHLDTAPLIHFIAVRIGVGNSVTNCIFSNWEDARIHIEGPGAEYSIFDNISEAVKYAFEIDLQHIDSSHHAHSHAHAHAIDAEHNITDSILAENLMEQILPSNSLLRIHAPHVHEDFISLAHDAAAAMNRDDDDVHLQHSDIDLPQHLPPEHHRHDQLQNDLMMNSTMGQAIADAHEEVRLHVEQMEANTKGNLLFESIATNQFSSISTTPCAQPMDQSRGLKRKRKSVLKMLSKKEVEWNQKYNLLITYMHHHNLTNASSIPSKLPPQFSTLNPWINAQKNEYRKLQSTGDSNLTAAQVQKLNDVGIKFTKKRDYVNWEKKMEELREFKEIHGHARVPVSHPILGSWVSDQRKDYKVYMNNDPKTKLTQDKLQALIDVGFVFEAAKKSQQYDSRSSAKSWEERFEELKEYKSHFGHTIVPQHYPNLGWWVNTQRKEHKKLKSGKKTSFTIERCLKLTEIGFCFDASNKRGSTNYDYDVPT